MSMDFSIVEYYAEHEGYRCGYCKSMDTNYSHGMWAHTMTVQDYQDLIDRGWRRSGMYCYKPTMDRTCCPMYTIRCAVLDLKLSRSQKKVLKRMNAFLCRGVTQVDRSSRMEVSYDVDVPGHRTRTLHAEKNSGATKVTSLDESIMAMEPVRNRKEVLNNSEVNKVPVSLDSRAVTQAAVDSKNLVRQGDVSRRDESRPPRRKAKLLRLERKLQKLMARGHSEEEARQLIRSRKRPANNQGKSLEQFLAEATVPSPAHKLEVVLVAVRSCEFERSATASHALFAKYQMCIHGEDEDECGVSSFYEFLVTSPLTPWQPSDGPPCGYGSFHQQYWLDGRLIAVGVIDILPRCVSSVYFYYDPELSQLSLGTYASLRELEFTRTLRQVAPSLQYYYMGFYIHSCPKMRYKASYSPSYLLCPETYRWYPAVQCRPWLDERAGAVETHGHAISSVRCAARSRPRRAGGGAVCTPRGHDVHMPYVAHQAVALPGPSTSSWHTSHLWCTLADAVTQTVSARG